MKTNSTDKCLKRRDGNATFPNQIIFNLSLTSRKKQIFYIEPIADLCMQDPNTDFQISLLSIFVTFEDNRGLVKANFDLVTERKDNFGYKLNSRGWEDPSTREIFNIELIKTGQPNRITPDFGHLDIDSEISVHVDGQNFVAPEAYPRGCTHRIV